MSSKNESPQSEREPIEQIPSFLYKQDGQIFTGEPSDTDVTDKYQYYLKDAGKEAPKLPSFLYEKDDFIFIGVPDDTNVTEVWNDWLESIESKK